MNKKVVLILVLLFGAFGLANAQGNDPKFGTIKVRKYEEQQFYVHLEYVPKYKDGADALLDDIQAGIIYPEEAIKQNISGTVLVKVIIDKFGNVINTSVDTSPNNVLNSAAMTAAKGLKKFEPHVIKEMVVPAEFILPIKFILPL